jgi:hypothetical protein
MIFRIKHDHNYTTLSNKMLDDNRLSFKARGLLSFMLTKPNDWQFHRNELKDHSDMDGNSSIGSAIKELIKTGYLTCHQKKDDEGRWAESEWEVRESPAYEKPSTGLPAAVNTIVLSTDRRLSTDINKGTKKFDPLDLPVHLAKHPTVVKAWSEFVEHRKERHAPLTERACIKLHKKMIHQSPEDITAVIDKAIESGWRGLFFNQRHIAPSCKQTSLNSDAQRLYDFAASILGANNINQTIVCQITRDVSDYYKRTELLRNPRAPDHGPTDHLSWSTFFSDWLQFLFEKQGHFPLRSVYDLQVGKTRWNEYIQRCERQQGYNFTTGRRIE